jgi:hypothetical protein
MLQVNIPHKINHVPLVYPSSIHRVFPTVSVMVSINISISTCNNKFMLLCIIIHCFTHGKIDAGVGLEVTIT